jgi:hypothetical protein
MTADRLREEWRPREAPPPGPHPWRWYWVSAIIFWGGLVLWIPGGKLVESLGPPWIAMFIYPICTFFLMGACFFYLGLFTCPRCRRGFFDLGASSAIRLLAIVASNKCHTCGLRAGQDPRLPRVGT